MSGTTLENEPCYIGQQIRGPVDPFKARDGLDEKLFGQLSRAVDAVNARVGRLVRGDVLLRRLSKRFGGLRYVEQVVGDLKQQPEARRVIGDRIYFFSRSAADENTGLAAGSDQRAGFQARGSY